jgi:type IV secretion system protein VirD4
MIGRLIALLARIVFLVACGVFAWGVVLIGMRFPFVALGVAGLVAWRRLRRGHASNWSHGSAEIAGLPLMERGGLLDDDGLILGRCLPEKPSKPAALLALLSPQFSSETACRMFLAAFFGAQWSAGRMVRTRNHVHLATFAPAGAGKGVAVLVPNLRSYRGNCVVTDPKGELFKLTAHHRQKKFGHTIIRLDPFGVCGPGSDTLNPLDFIDAKADDFLDACRDLSNMLVVRTGQEKDPHWNDSAELNLTAFTAFTCGFEPDPKLRTLATVRSIASSRHSYARAVEIMQQVDACQGVIQRLGSLLTWFTGEEQSSVLSTFQRHTAFLDSPAVTRNTAKSSFDPMILRRGKATVYLILPADRLASLAPLQRMWVGTLMRVITRGAPTEKCPVLWLLDEMAHIGHMRAIEDAVTLMRGMGMRLWFFFQSLDQLKTCFGEHAPTVLDNIGTQQFFGVNSYQTADDISKRIGDATIAIRSVNDTSSDSQPVGGSGPHGPPAGSRSSSRSVTSSDIARRLLKPEEILTLPNDVMLIFHKNLPVVTARLIKYFSAPEFRWGGSGKQRRLGLAAGVMAVFMLTASVLFTETAASLPPPARVRRQTSNRPQPYGYGTPMPYGTTGYPAYRSAAPAARRRSSNLPSESGFLIEIK